MTSRRRVGVLGERLPGGPGRAAGGGVIVAPLPLFLRPLLAPSDDPVGPAPAPAPLAPPAVARRIDPAGARARASHDLLASQLRARTTAAPVPVSSTAGYARLTPEEQAQLTLLTTGDNPIANATRAQVDALTSSAAFRAATPDQQAAMLREVLQTPALKQMNQVDAHREAPVPPIAGPTEVKSHRFKNPDGSYTNKPALRYDVTIDGRVVPVFVAQPVDPNSTQPSVEQIAKGLASLPPESRSRVNEVRVDNKPNPEAFMYAGDDGIVNIWPPKWRQAQPQIDAIMLHETGHIISSQEWGSSRRPEPEWKQWEEAAKKDGCVPSEYAKKNSREDFAETYALYMMVRSTPQEAAVRAMFPARFAMIDEMLKNA